MMGIGVKALTLCLATSMMSACGSDDETIRDGLIGTWFADGDVVGSGFTFLADGTYESDIVDLRDTSVIDVLAIVGVYELVSSETGIADENGNHLLLLPTMASCPVGPSPVDHYVELEGDSLRLVNETGAILLERVRNDGEGSGLVRYGCFTPDGFVPFPLQQF